MKLIHLAVVAAFIVSGYAEAQTEERREDRNVARLCIDDAQHLCSGKTGQELQQCLKSGLGSHSRSGVVVSMIFAAASIGGVVNSAQPLNQVISHADRVGNRSQGRIYRPDADEETRIHDI